MDNDKFIPSDKHIFTQKTLEKIDIGVVYTSMVANRESIFVFGGDDGGVLHHQQKLGGMIFQIKSGIR